MTRTVLITDHVFGGVGIERAALAEIGRELREAPATDEDTLVSLADDVEGILVCYAAVGARLIPDSWATRLDSSGPASHSTNSTRKPAHDQPRGRCTDDSRS